MHFIHRWSKWTDPVLDKSSKKRQWRTCETCGKTVHRLLKKDGGTDPEKISKALARVTGADSEAQE